MLPEFVNIFPSEIHGTKGNGEVAITRKYL